MKTSALTGWSLVVKYQHSHVRGFEGDALGQPYDQPPASSKWMVKTPTTRTLFESGIFAKF